MALKDVAAANLKRRRIRMNLTQFEVAARAGLSVSMVSMLERGERAATLDTLEALAAALETKPTSLLHAA